MRTKVISRVRNAVVTAAAAVSLLAPAARAQQEVQAAQPNAQPVQREARPAKAQPDAAPAPADAPPDPSAEARTQDGLQPSEVRGQLATPTMEGDTQIYTIQKGDTLWDLSQKFLASPWYWPKIWSLNAYIENPHWIFPGNKITVTQGKGGAPAQVELQDGLPRAAEGAEAADDAAPIPKSDDALDFAVMSGGPKETAAALRSVTVAGRLSFVPPPALSVRASGLVTPDELKQAGRIDASFEEKQMLATYDQAYIRFKTEVPAGVGDKLLIFRPDEGTITDPVTHRKLAERTKTVGEVTVLAVDGKSATVQVGRVWDEIERGDRVRPWSEQSKHIAPRPNRTALEGVIISGVNPTLTTFGEANEVFINKGSADGVEEGNTFTVVRKGDGLGSTGAGFASYTGGSAGASASRLSLPDEAVGILIVVDVKDRVSTAVVVKSIRELEAGERVAMRSAAGGTGN